MPWLSDLPLPIPSLTFGIIVKHFRQVQAA